jgi:hypothetical protein
MWPVGKIMQNIGGMRDRYDLARQRFCCGHKSITLSSFALLQNEREEHSIPFVPPITLTSVVVSY